MTRRSFALLFSVALASPSAAAPIFVGLGYLPGDDVSQAAGVSGNGAVVVGGSGSTVSNADPLVQPVRWTAPGGAPASLGVAPRGNANDASVDGSVIVGGTVLGTAFRWTSAGGATSLGTLAGGTQSAAFATSGDGSLVIGFSDRPAPSGPGLVNEAFRWTQAGGMVGLGDLPGGDFESIAYDVSADGSVVTGFSSSSTGNQAFRWTAAGGMQGLGRIELFSIAQGISADGTTIVGGSGRFAFRWTSATGMVALPRLTGGSSTDVALKASADGTTIVGYSFGALGVQTAFIWDAAHGTRSLKTVLQTDYGLDLTGWTLQVAGSISDDGRTIVGVGINPSGQREAWYAFVPEPTTASLLCLGLAALAARRRLAPIG